MRSLLALLFTVLALHLAAQRYYFENVSVANGLPASNVYAVLQDSTGLVWLGTESGLASYDGVTVTTFGPAEGMASGGVRSLFLDKDKHLWCGHSGGGISVSEGRRFRSLAIADQPLTADVTAIAQQSDGSIWFGTYGMGALRLKALPDQGAAQVEHFEGAKGPGERITSIVRRHNGDLVFVEAGSGLHQLDVATNTFSNFPVASLADLQGITCFFEDASRAMWVGTQEHGAVRCDAKGQLTYFENSIDPRMSNFVYAFGEEQDGHVWISTWENGLLRVEKEGLRLFNKTNGLHSQTIRAMVRDREGNLLIATKDAGLDIYKGDRFRIFTDEDGLAERHVWAVAETPDGRVWFGTDGGITTVDPYGSGPLSVNKLTVANWDLTTNNIRCFQVDRTGHIYIGTENGGLLKADVFGGRPEPLLELSALLGNNKVTALALGREGGLFVGTAGSLIHLVPGGVPNILRKADGLAGNDVTALFNDSKGNTWVGTASSGVSVIGPGSAASAKAIDLGQIITPTCFTEDASGKIWVGTQSQGILVLDNGKIATTYDVSSGLLANNVRSLITDANGHIWIGTNKGLNEHKKDGNTFLSFTGRSGFTGIEANAGAVCRTHSGDLWFGTANGADHVVIDHGEERTEAPLIAVRVLKVNLEERDAIDGVDLSHNERDVRIEFGCVSLSDQGAVRYQYKLEGLEKDWQPVTAETDAHYPGLSPGRYAFVVRARNRSGVWSDPPVTYHFTVLPPWYRTGWFFTILTVVVVASAYTYVKFRERQLRLRNVVLERKVTERTAEVVAQSKEIAGQKVQIEDLLLNILPKEISDELKEKGKATARQHENVTVMFTDMKGFTKVAETMTPQQLVSELDECFIRFDAIIDRYGIEKIKTIGDSYMCACGVPSSDQHHAVKAVMASIDVRTEMLLWKQEREAKGMEAWVLRIGLHSGPVVAGVVGKRKFAYDIWGDAVNTASRMESSGEPGEVNVSGTTYELVKDWFVCTHRGKVQAKNKGEIDMYFVRRIKPEFSADSEGLIPNARFRKAAGLPELEVPVQRAS